VPGHKKDGSEKRQPVIVRTSFFIIFVMRDFSRVQTAKQDGTLNDSLCES
jgi:hypothetical protein